MSTAVYVYGIVPGDTQLTVEHTGVGEPPGEVRIVRGDGVAALVSDVDTGRPLGRPDDMQAHARVLDSTAASTTVLPLRFGAVVTDEDAVRSELLEPNSKTFESALESLAGHAQYLISGRYVENAILQEILDENDDAQRLRNESKTPPWNSRMPGVDVWRSLCRDRWPPTTSWWHPRRCDMGIIGLPSAPLRGVMWLGRVIQDEVDRVLHDPASSSKRVGFHRRRIWWEATPSNSTTPAT